MSLFPDRTWLVTGGCGFVGSNVAARLISGGARVIVADNLSRVGSAANLAWLRTLGPVTYEPTDMRMRAEVDALLDQHRPDAIFHLAGQVAMTTSVADPRLDFETNALGSFNLLDAVRRIVPRATVVYASSNKSYGELSSVRLVEGATRYEAPDHPEGIDESAPLALHTPYGCSKGAADQYMLDFARVYGLNTVVFRHSTMYGGRQFATFDQGWVGWFCQQAAAVQRDPTRAPFTIAGDGKQVRDLLYVDDAVDAYLAADAHIHAARGEVFNIGGGVANSCSLLELFAVLEDHFGVALRYERLPWRLSDQRYFVADNRKATRTLGWAPRVDRAEGIARMIAWTGRMSDG